MYAWERGRSRGSASKHHPFVHFREPKLKTTRVDRTFVSLIVIAPIGTVCLAASVIGPSKPTTLRTYVIQLRVARLSVLNYYSIA